MGFMKYKLFLLFSFIAHGCFSQPTGHQKLFLEMSDHGDTIHFENRFNESTVDRHTFITYRGYQLRDASASATGFSYHQPRRYIHKTLMTRNHRLQLIKNNTDTMEIEILNAYNVYFLHISFHKGKFRMYVNDGIEHRWLNNTLPYKTVDGYPQVYDITPPDWNEFKVDDRKSIQDYFISNQFKKRGVLAMPVAPEDDPNFTNPRRVKHLKMEFADYNFDGHQDYRERKWKDSTQWNYFIYQPAAKGYVLDTLLSSLDLAYFDFDKKTFSGQKSTRTDLLNTQTDYYAFVNGQFKLIRQMFCTHAFPHSEKVDCSVYELIDDKMQFKNIIKGCE